MHPPPGVGGNALPLNAALSSAYLQASGTCLPSAPSYCRHHFQFLLRVYFITATVNPWKLGCGHHGSVPPLLLCRQPCEGLHYLLNANLILF